MWQLLVKEGFDCSSRNREGQTPADCALVMGHTVLAERIRELGWDRYKDMPAFNAYTAPPPNEDADDGRSAQRLCRDAHLAAESAAAANKAPDPTNRPPSARPSARKGSQGGRRPWPHAHEGGMVGAGVGAAEGAAGAAQGRPAGVLADPSRAHLAVRPEIINKTPPRSHVRALPVFCQRACFCVSVMLSSYASGNLGLTFNISINWDIIYKFLFYWLVCLRRCLLEDSGVGALVSSLKELQAGEELVPELLRE